MIGIPLIGGGRNERDYFTLLYDVKPGQGTP
jgi:hypothetical protein